MNIIPDGYFTQYVKDQLSTIIDYLKEKRASGDTRDKQEIIKEWIDNNAAKFRENWIS